ncbi:MAG TPA: hypothetical protein VFX20_04430 [Steroidobacteraceae bacterium]|nr:hypothetical protein [Steroidobacteraceae bacterium]
MRHVGSLAVAACALALGAQWPVIGRASGRGADPGTHAAAAAPRPALWRTFNMIVNLQNLPRTYTCNQLWYELHGILQRMGAWPYSINILPYNCSPTPSGYMRSPDVQVGFQLPFFLQGAAAKTAPAKAVERTIRLSPGEPQTLHSSDCELMQQLSQTLLASLPVRVDEQHFNCSAPPPRAADFTVTLTLPMAVHMPNAAPAGRVSAGRVPH